MEESKTHLRPCHAHNNNDSLGHLDFKINRFSAAEHKIIKKGKALWDEDI